MFFEQAFIDRLRLQNGSALTYVQPENKRKTAAVLVPLTLIEQQWHLLFIRRAQVSGDVHSGQVAFPGGACEPADDGMEQTALRESYEEIGLRATDVRVLGRLPDFQSISQYCVTPIVGVIPWPYALQLQEREVSHVFTIPLDWLNEPRHYQRQTRAFPGIQQKQEVIYYRPYKGEQLWGLTARIVQCLLENIMDNDIRGSEEA